MLYSKYVCLLLPPFRSIFLPSDVEPPNMETFDINPGRHVLYEYTCDGWAYARSTALCVCVEVRFNAQKVNHFIGLVAQFIQCVRSPHILCTGGKSQRGKARSKPCVGETSSKRLTAPLADAGAAALRLASRLLRSASRLRLPRAAGSSLLGSTADFWSRSIESARSLCTHRHTWYARRFRLSASS